MEDLFFCGAQSSVNPLPIISHLTRCGFHLEVQVGLFYIFRISDEHHLGAASVPILTI